MIEVQGLVKYFGTERVLDHLSFSVSSGEIVGFLGPNGAGKTTTMRILTGYLPPSAGSVKINGLEITEHSLEIRKHIGYLPETTPLYPDMRTWDYLEFMADMRNLPPAQKQQQIDQVIEACGLSPVLFKRIETLSKGYKQRVGLAQALLHNPDILILDEPTSGLDPNQIIEIRALIQSIGQEKTVLLSTHILSEVQASCNRVLIIHQGRIVADASPEALTRQAPKQQILLGFKNPPEQVRPVLEQIPYVHLTDEEQEPEGSWIFTLTTDTTEDIRPDLFQLAVDNGWTLTELHRKQANLEEIFRELTT